MDLAAVEEQLQELLAQQSSLLDRRKELQALIDQNNVIEKQKKAQKWEGTGEISICVVWEKKRFCI